MLIGIIINQKAKSYLIGLVKMAWSIDSLHMEDRHLLLKMILETCDYNECCNTIINKVEKKIIYLILRLFSGLATTTKIN
jgi:hypothetical protein